MPAQPIASRFASPDSSSGPREIRTVPDPGRTSEARILMSVVLPLPLGPATAVSPVSMEKERPLKRGGPAKDFESPIASSFVGSTAARDDSRVQAGSWLESLRSVLYDPPDLKICLSSAYRGARVDAVRRRE